MGRHHALKPHHLYLSPPSHSAFNLFDKTTYTSPSSLLQTSSISALAVRDRIPGLKVSAAFLSSLHSNIFIELDSNYDSPDQTPFALRPTAVDFPPSPLIQSMSNLADAEVAPPDALSLPDNAVAQENVQQKEPTVGEDGIPILKTISATDNDQRAEALHIIADSVAQQRNTGSRALILHPLSVAGLIAALAVILQLSSRNGSLNWLTGGMTFMGVLMSFLGGVRLLMGPYIFEAERVGTWKWLNQGRSAEEEEQSGVHVLGEGDEILLTKFGEEYIGAIIFRGVQPSTLSSGNKKSRRAQSPTKRTSMVIRGWSVRQKYRRKEVGSALIEDALKIGKEKGWTMNGVDFAEDHANHKRVLPAMFNGPMDKFDEIAHSTLGKKIQELGLVQDKGRKKK